MRITALAAALTCAAGASAARDMNISQFVFRDLNRNGVFDLGESPFAGARIRLEQDGADPVVETSNLAGFANFEMSDDEEEASIRREGAVSFNVELPEGYELTAGASSHPAQVRAMDAAPGGFVMDPPNPFIGLAPVLNIEASAEGVRTMTCEYGGTLALAERSGDSLICDAGPGEWVVTWEMEDGAVLTRTVAVGDWPVRLPVSESGAVTGEPIVEDFEGIIRSENIQEMAASGGFEWHNMVAVHRKFYGGWGYVNGTASGEFAGYNSSGHPARLFSDDPFTFQGALISVAWPRARRHPVRLTALREGEVVAEDAFYASNMRPVWFDAAWGDIDTLVISHDAYWQVVVDDVTVSR